MILKTFFGDEYDFYDDNQLLTNLLSGDIGSGKTSFIIQYLFYLVQVPRDKDGNINRAWKLPFTQIHINVDGFDFQKFNELAKNNGLDLTFHWLDFKHFEEFAKVERELYTKFNSDGGGEIAKNQIKHMPDEYKKYLHSLIVCDEADHWITKINPDLANFLKWKRHLGLGVWFITQKYQNLDSSFYNSGAINRFLHIRNPLFNAFGYKFIEHWSASNRQKTENLVNTYHFKILPEIYSLYDSGANLGATEKQSSTIKKWLYLLPIGLIFGVSLLYYIFSSFVSVSDSSPSEKKAINRPSDSNKTRSSNGPRKAPINFEDKKIVRCVRFNYYLNCYSKSYFASYDAGYIKRLISDDRFDVEILSQYRNETYLLVDFLVYDFLFNNNFDKKDKNDKDTSSSITVF